MSSDCQKGVSANAQPILPRLGEDEEEGPFNDERKLKKTAKPMHLTVDPLLALQLLVAVLIVLTMPDNNESSQPQKSSKPECREPFQLADGNTYVEHAGMAVEADLIRSFKTAL